MEYGSGVWIDDEHAPKPYVVSSFVTVWGPYGLYSTLIVFICIEYSEHLPRLNRPNLEHGWSFHAMTWIGRDAVILFRGSV
jgi:hypothetical protein